MFGRMVASYKKRTVQNAAPGKSWNTDAFTSRTLISFRWFTLWTSLFGVPVIRAMAVAAIFLVVKTPGHQPVQIIDRTTLVRNLKPVDFRRAVRVPVPSVG